MLEQTWRWYGPNDPVSLIDIVQTGATGIVTALHHMPIGEIWGLEDIKTRKNKVESVGLRWSVVESLPIHEEIKTRGSRAQQYLDKYKVSLKNLSQAGMDVVCYNFMPVVDWTRTNLNYNWGDGSLALRFSWTELALFDVHILKRQGAAGDYNKQTLEEADKLFSTLDEKALKELTDTIIMGLPGSDLKMDLNTFKQTMSLYDDISQEQYREHLKMFLSEIIPIAEENGIKMCIHPDDPPFRILGLPRIVSTNSDYDEIMKSVNTHSNGITFCTGSLGADPENDPGEMIKKWGSRIHFVHLRNVKNESYRTFFEANHLEGDTDMVEIMKLLIKVQNKREDESPENVSIPYRPDHGHLMIDDLNKKTNPGYSCIGRLRGLAELRGLEMGIRSNLGIT
jgi:mannonate dehydratase